MYVNVLELNPDVKSDGTECGTAIAVALDAAYEDGLVPVFPAGEYRTARPLPLRGIVMGAGYLRTTFVPVDSAAFAGGSGVFDTRLRGEMGELRQVSVDGKGITAGNGVVLSEQTSAVYDCRIDNFRSLNATEGHAIALRPDGHTAVNIRVQRVRLGGYGARIWQEAGQTPKGQPIFTDWIFEDVICLTEGDKGRAEPDIWMQNSGGGQIRHLHTNGSGGDGIRLHNAYQLTLDQLYLDGWGCSAAADDERAAIRIDKMVSGGVVNIGQVNLDRRAKGRIPVYVDPSSSYPVHIASLIGEPGGDFLPMVLPSSAVVGLTSGV